ncbi:ATP-binding protein [Paenibacillus lycopersici]|uniref:ATP-binding protein n=1 Tax=Paenibacillus lycopersici TaxID=2704462 RepID=A0A6C0FWP4_9BACL|nr:ATP-binding protein [Paenibacillus lycopersici]QHT58610.1 ATP-binding protein [Paenibacillus lycopersici]
MSELFIPIAYEDIISNFPSSELDLKLMEFVEPNADMEIEINTLCLETRHSGKIVFILGRPGTGKSTFIHSLKWRPNISLRTLVSVDAAEIIKENNLSELLDEIKNISLEAIEKKDKGPTALIIDYLEDLQGFEEGNIKSFFRNLNGVLRKSPLLIIWPVTEKREVDAMLSYAESVSGTLFLKGKEVLAFTGPHTDKFVDIAKRTLSVLNAGKELDDFNLIHEDLVDTLIAVLKLPKIDINLREYYKLLKTHWQQKSGYLRDINSKIPKPTEVWFLFAYKNAEDIVAQFSRKTTRIEDAWSVITDRFSEYIDNNSQRKEAWNARRLQLAFYGALKTRVMYMPTNTLVSILASYSEHAELNKLLDSMNIPENWGNKSKAISSLKRSPMYRQLVGEVYPSGKRKGGPTGVALEKAEPIFGKVVNWISTAGSDKALNKGISIALGDAGIGNSSSEKPHPWIPGIIPDIFIDLPDKQICIEFHYTNKSEPYVLADYVLKKLDVYVAQLTSLISLKL